MCFAQMRGAPGSSPSVTKSSNRLRTGPRSMETIASLVALVACVAAIAGWVAAGSERISYAGLQIAFAFFYSVFQGYAPDTDLDNVRAIVPLESFLDSSSPHSSSITSGPSALALESNEQEASITA